MRAEVKQFGEAMEMVLQQNDHKGGWVNESPEWLRKKLLEEVSEYFIATGDYDDLTIVRMFIDELNDARAKEDERKPKQTTVQKELVDVANMAMMLWDNSNR